MRHFITTILIIALCSSVLAQEKETDWKFKSAKAKAAIKKYEAAGKKLDDAYAKHRKKNRLDLILALEEALKEATKKGDLDDAVKIRDAIKALHEGEEPLIKAQPGTTVRARIPKGAVKFQRHHYYVFMTAVTWHDAKAKCESLGGHLARVKNDEQNSFLVALMRQVGVRHDAWIDGSNAANHSQWVFSTGQKMTFFKWAKDGKPGPGTYRILIALPWKGDWGARGENKKFVFICEWDK